MRAGTLRHRVTLKRPIPVTTNIYGEKVGDTHEPVASGMPGGTFFAEILPQAGTEVESSRQVQGMVSHRIRMRFIPGLNVGAQWIVEYQARRFEVVSVVDIDERKKEVSIAAREMVGQFPSV